MTRSPARPEPTFYYKLKPTVKELLETQELFRLKILEGKKLSENARISLEKTKDHYNQRCANGGQVSPMEWQMLDRDTEAHGIAVRERGNQEIRLRNRIGLGADKIAAMWTDLSDDLENDFIGTVQFLEYLKLYKQVLENSNGFECFSKPIFNQIRLAIEKHIPV